MSQYADFDRALIGAIGSGVSGFTGLCIRLKHLSHPLAAPGTPDYRVTDRRLQALRKAGKIAYSPKGGWAVTQQAEELK